MAIKARNVNEGTQFSFWPVYKEVGNTANATSAGTFNRLTGKVFLTRPFLLEAVIWNIFTTQTYTLELVNNVSASPTVLRTLASNVSLTGGSIDNKIAIAPVLLLDAGAYHLSLYCSTAVRQRRHSTFSIREAEGYLIFDGIGYDGGSTSTGSAPFKFAGYGYEFAGW